MSARIKGDLPLPTVMSCLAEDIEGALKEIDEAVSGNVAELSGITSDDADGHNVLQKLAEAATWLAMAKREVEQLDARIKEGTVRESEAAE